MYCSNTCVKASAKPFANCRFGIDAITLGSSIENSGNRPGPPIPNFSLVSALVITAPEFISDPVAGKVSTTPNGIPFSVRILLLKISQGEFPVYNAADDKNFVPSITDPPPTANK